MEMVVGYVGAAASKSVLLSLIILATASLLADRVLVGHRVEEGLEFVVVQALGQCPVHAGHARVAGYLADSGFGDAEGGTDLTGAQGPAVQQLQCVS